MILKYKSLTKKVRKFRSAAEIVEDALTLHEEKVRKKNGEDPLTSKTKSKRHPPTAFNIFWRSKRVTLIQKHPELKFAEVHKKICQKWKELSVERREKYMRKAEKAKKEFYEDIKKNNEEKISQIKKPLSAYNMWKSERVDDNNVECVSEKDLVADRDNLSKSTEKGLVQVAASEINNNSLKETSMLGKKDKKHKSRKRSSSKRSSSEQMQRTPNKVSKKDNSSQSPDNKSSSEDRIFY